MTHDKPLVAAALVCEKILVEKDGVSSAIRIVDSFTVQPPETPPPGIEAGIRFFVLVILKSGLATGNFEIGLQIRRPSGDAKAVPERWPATFKGGEHGFNLNAAIELGSLETGLYWIDVLCNDETLTSIPIKVQIAPRPASGNQPGTSSQQ